MDFADGPDRFLHAFVRVGVSNVWSLRAFSSEQAVRLFLRARAVINFVTRAASTLQLQMASIEHFVKIYTSWNISLLKRAK